MFTLKCIIEMLCVLLYTHERLDQINKVFLSGLLDMENSILGNRYSGYVWKGKL